MQRRDFFRWVAGLLLAPVFVLLAVLGNVGTAWAQGEVPQATTTPTATPSPTATCMPQAAAIDTQNKLNVNQLYGVDIVSASDAWAVGLYYRSNYGISFTLAEHWNGSQWLQIASPNPSPSTGGHDVNVLRSVAAVSANDVWAVGSGSGPYARTLIEHWNGSAWSIVPSPNVGTQSTINLLYGVSAVSANDIWAVGMFNGASASGALTLHYDGTTWSIVPNSVIASLSSVSAISANDVWAVGGPVSGSPGSAIAAHWDGTAWTQTVLSIPMPYNAVLTGVSAVSQSDVWAVGYYGQAAPSDPLIAHWDGTAWTLVTALGYPGAANQLMSVSARSASDIWAVGTYRLEGTNTQNETLTMHYDGTTWTTIAGADIDPNQVNNGLNAVATSASETWAVGYAGMVQTRAERWSGVDWTIAPSQNPGRGDNVLFGVAGVSPIDIWAVGYHDTETNSGYGAHSGLLEHWNGVQWNIVDPPATSSGSGSELRSIAALASNNVWAAGVNGPGPEYRPYVIHWDGTSWSNVDVPNPDPNYDNNIFGIAALSPNDIYVVGSYGFNPRPLIMHYDGSTWTIVADTGTPRMGLLYGVGGTSSSDVWAVGYSDYSPEPTVPLVLHYDGTAWSQAAVLASSGYLQSVTALSPTDAWAVGSDYSNAENKSLTLHWNGTAWSQVSAPSAAAPNQTWLTSVSAAAPDDVWAAGYFGSGINSGPWVIHWDGTSWSPAGAQNVDVLGSRLQGVKTFGPGDTWLVGSHFDGAVRQTLSEHIGRFSDVYPNDYYNTAVNWLVAHNAISGYADCTFRPGENATRSQVTKIIVLAEGWALDTAGGPHFTDVPTNDPFYGYVETAYNHGIISGYANGTFRPLLPITRAQLAKVIVLAEGWTLDTTAGPHFTDVPVGSAFYAYVETAFAHGVISGYADHTFRPGGNATRGQIAKMVYNAVTGL